MQTIFVLQTGPQVTKIIVNKTLTTKSQLFNSDKDSDYFNSNTHEVAIYKRVDPGRPLVEGETREVHEKATKQEDWSYHEEWVSCTCYLLLFTQEIH